MARLEDLEVAEVSLVDAPANKRRFLLTKNQGDASVDELIALTLETEAENEAELNAVLAEKDLPEDTTAALRGTFRLLNAHRESITGDLIKELLIKSGFIAVKDEVVKPEVKEVEKAKVSDDPLAVITKADGTIDLESVPEAIRPALERLWNERHDADEERKAVQKTLDDERLEKRTAEFITKAQGYKLPNLDADMMANLLMKAEDDDPDTYAALTTWLKSLSEVIGKSNILKEVGHSGDDDAEGSAYETAKKRAASKDVSVDEVLKADRELAKQHSDEMRLGS
jgi:hypothetical protein